METFLATLPSSLLPALSFETPWILAALAVLPLLWWLLRLTPPAPRTALFPAIRFLFGLRDHEQTAAHTPWWIILLRLALAVTVILAAAHPILNAVRTVPGQPLLLIIDDDWAAARFWQHRKAEAERALDQAERAAVPVRLLTSAPPADNTPLALGPELSATDARALLQTLAPKPWSADRTTLLRLIEAMPAPERPVRVLWLSNGLNDPQVPALQERLQRLGGGVTLQADIPANLPRVLLPPRADAAGFSVDVRRAPDSRPQPVVIRALDERGQVLGRIDAAFAPNETALSAHLAFPGELRNQVVRLDLENESSAAAVALLDERWKYRPVGIVSSGGPRSVPLLDDTYYIERALAPFADIRRDTVTNLLKQPLAILFLGDAGHLSPDETATVEKWIAKGGILVRFAGPRLAGAEQGASSGIASGNDPLLPVRLRGGSRVLGGAMSWTTPADLAAFPENSPFAGLTADQIKIYKQVLAEPSLDLADKTWARLSDGTPLVTAARRDAGWNVLFHTTAAPDWSDLSLSGLFVDMLRRLLALSQGTSGQDIALPLAPQDILDGFGHTAPPSPVVRSLTVADIATTIPGPTTPPGFYGSAATRQALNLGPSLPALVPLKAATGVTYRSYGDLPAERDLLPHLIVAALFLALLDTILSLALRGVFARAPANKHLALWLAAGVCGALLFAAPEARALTEDDAFLLQVTERPPLAYVLTHDSRIDSISQSGLFGLSNVLAQRTTAVMGPPVGIDIEQDSLLFYPTLYWPVSPSQPVPSAAAQDKINDYLRRGGMILFDTGTADGFAAPLPPNDGTLARLTVGLDIPPLTPVSDTHVLTRTFYLLRDMPGRFAGDPVWVATDVTANDGVSPVIVGAGGWAAAWAMDQRGEPLHAVIPGGEAQREMAKRFGVNWIMYALTGNYKADQVHTPAILERLGR